MTMILLCDSERISSFPKVAYGSSSSGPRTGPGPSDFSTHAPGHSASLPQCFLLFSMANLDNKTPSLWLVYRGENPQLIWGLGDLKILTSESVSNIKVFQCFIFGRNEKEGVTTLYSIVFKIIIKFLRDLYP